MEHTLALIEKAHEGDKAARDELVKENFLYNFASSNIHYIAPALFFPRWGLVYRI